MLLFVSNIKSSAIRSRQPRTVHLPFCNSEAVTAFTISVGGKRRAVKLFISTICLCVQPPLSPARRRVFALYTSVFPPFPLPSHNPLPCYRRCRAVSLIIGRCTRVTRLLLRHLQRTWYVRYACAMAFQRHWKASTTHEHVCCREGVHTSLAVGRWGGGGCRRSGPLLLCMVSC